MRSSRLTPVAGWCAATATSIVLSWVALLPVLRTASPSDEALSAIDRLPAAQTATATLTTTPATPPSTDPTTKATKAAQPVTKKPTTQPAKAPVQNTAAATTTTEDGWTVTDGSGNVRTYVKAFKVAGGQAVIKETSDGAVSLVTATPADGYSVEKDQDSPDDLAVYFNEPNHSFIIHATWWNNGPFAQVSEVGQ